MGNSGSFPFGWVRGFEDDNWQLIWNKNTKEFFVKSVVGNKTMVLGNFSHWKDAKEFADSLIKNPKLLKDFF